MRAAPLLPVSPVSTVPTTVHLRPQATSLAKLANFLPDITSAVERGSSFVDAAIRAGIAPRSAQMYQEVMRNGSNRWPGSGEPITPAAQTFLAQIADQIAAAQAIWRSTAVENIRQAGEMTGKSGVREWRATAWLLNNSPDTRREFHEYREQHVEHAGTVDHAHRLVQELPDQEYLGLCSPEIAALLPTDAALAQQDVVDGQASEVTDKRA